MRNLSIPADALTCLPEKYDNRQQSKVDEVATRIVGHHGRINFDFSGVSAGSFRQ